MSDLYSILEIDKNANQDEIKKAYRRLSKKYHPDVNRDPNAESKFKDISSAYETLSDSTKKSNYDNHGSATGNTFGGGYGSMNDIFSQFGDIFGNRSGGQQRPQSRGSNLRIKVSLTIDEILKGAIRKLKYKRQDKCQSCNGIGGTDPRNCIPCNGSGQRTIIQNTPFGQIRQVATCPDCSGSGKVVSVKCNSCRGEGTSIKEQVVDVEIPKGVSNGMQLAMQGFGNFIKNGSAGDLQIIIEEVADYSYKREGNNIIVEKTISVIDAIIGSNIKVSTPHGEMPIAIEPGTEHGKVYRISGKGIPDINYGLGDLYVKISVKIPKKIELDEKYVLEKLKSSKNFQV